MLAPLTVAAGDWRMNSAKSLAPLAPPVSHGNCLSYDYLDLGLVRTDFGSSYLRDSDGYGVGFSKSLGEHLFFVFDFADGEFDYDWYDHVVPVETQSYRLGLGARFGIAECVDLTLEGGARHVDTEFGPGYEYKDYDSWSWYFGPGVRAKMGRFEVYAKIFYTGTEGDAFQEYLSHHTTFHGRVDSNGWLFQPGLVYHVTDNLGVKFGIELDEIDTSYFAGVRLHY